MQEKQENKIKDITPALVRVIDDEPLARSVAGAANISKDLKNPQTLSIQSLYKVIVIKLKNE